MATTTAASRGTAVSTTGLVGGIAGGALGGMVFGMMMQMMGRMPMIAMLVGSSSIAVAWVTHLAVSMVLGLGFAITLGRSARTTGAAAGLGAVYGMVWWVLGGLVLMPLRLGMPTFHFDDMAWQSLMGHMVFGILLGLAFRQIARPSSAA